MFVAYGQERYALDDFDLQENGEFFIIVSHVPAQINGK